MVSYTAENKEEQHKNKLVEILSSFNKKLVKYPKRVARNYLMAARNVSVVALGVIAGMYLWEHDFNPFKKIDDPFKNETNIEKIVQDVKTWDGAREYLDKHMRYIKRDEIFKDRPNSSPFSIIHKIAGGVCADYTLAPYALLRDDKRYEVKGMGLNPNTKSIINTLYNWYYKITGQGYKNRSHAVCLVKDKEIGKYGILGQKTENIKPTSNSIDEAFDKLNLRWGFMWKDYELFDFDTSTVMYGKHIMDTSKLACPYYIEFNDKEGKPTPFLLNSSQNSFQIIEDLYSRNFEDRKKAINILDSVGVKYITRKVRGYRVNDGGKETVHMNFPLKDFEQPFEAVEIPIDNIK